MDVDLQGTHRNISCPPFASVCAERGVLGVGDRVPHDFSSRKTEWRACWAAEKQIPESVSVGLWRDNTPSFPLAPQISRRCSRAGDAGVHLSGLQPSAGQFLASLDPINEASAILSPLSSNPRNSVQHQFQDTFPGMETLPNAASRLGRRPHLLKFHVRRGLAIPELTREATRVRRESDRFPRKLAQSFVAWGMGELGSQKVCGGQVR